MPTAKIRAIKTTVKAADDLPGYVEALENGNPVLSFWAWAVQAMMVEGNGTTVVFKGDSGWHMPIAASLITVRSAVIAAQSAWQREQSRSKAANSK